MTTIEATMAQGQQAPLMLTSIQTVERDDICPDVLAYLFAEAVASLEDEAERREVAMDWESFRGALSTPNPPFNAKQALLVASINALPDS